MATATFRFTPDEINKIVCEYIAKSYNIQNANYLIENHSDGARSVIVSDGPKPVFKLDRDFLETDSDEIFRKLESTKPSTIKSSSSDA